MTPIAQVEDAARDHKMSYGNYVALYNPDDIANPEEERSKFRLYVKRTKYIPPIKCAFCGVLIENPKAQKTKYCSHNCRSKASYYRRKTFIGTETQSENEVTDDE